MELLPLESMLAIMVLVTIIRVFLTNVRAQVSTIPSPLLDMELKMEHLIGWSRIPGVTNGEMVAMSKLCVAKWNVVLEDIAHWWNVQNQDLLHQPHKLHLQQLFLQITFVILAKCMETPTSLETTN